MPAGGGGTAPGFSGLSAAGGGTTLRVPPTSIMNLLKLLPACAVAACCSQLQAAEPFHWGVNGHPVSQEAYWQVPLATQLDLVAESGATWYRFDLSAEAFHGNTDRVDELLAGAEKRKLRLLPVLFATPDAQRKNATPPQIRAAAAAFAQEVVSRYKGRITHWELNNELDAYAMIRKGEKTRGGKLWIWGDAEGSDPDTYDEGRYQKAKAEILGLHEGVKAADPQARTIVDTAGWLHYGFIERLVKEDHVPFDILAWHWYSECGDITRVQGKLNLIEFLKRYRAPLWLTEINRRDGSKRGKASEQAAYLGQTAAQLRANPGIAAYFVYELLDEPYFGADGESDYGLVEVAKDSAGKWQVSRRKPAFGAFKAATAKPVQP